MAKKVPLLKVIGIVWIAFATLYVLYGEYGRLKVHVAQRSYNTGIRDAVNQLIDKAQNCQPVPVTADGRSIEVIALQCLKNSEAEAATQ